MIKSILRRLRSAFRFALQQIWLLVGKKYRSNGTRGDRKAVAILVDKPWGYQLAELVDRFAEADFVTFVTWGPFRFDEKLTSRGKWLHSKANSWGSAANFAITKLNAESVLLAAQEFDLTLKQALDLLELPEKTSPVLLDSNGLVVSAGLVRKTQKDKFTHQLRDFNQADLPQVIKTHRGLPGCRIVVAHSRSNFRKFGSDASDLGVGQIATGIRVRYFKNHELPPEKVKVRIENYLGEALAPIGREKQRWAIKNPAWGNEKGDNWGDTYFVNDLAESLRAGGMHVAEDRYQNWYRSTRDLDDVELVIRGKYRYLPSTKATSILWVISHPELVTVAEVRSFDHVFAASSSWAKSMTEKSGKQIEVLLQATNPNRFKVQHKISNLASEVLFVGRTRGVFRQVVDYAIRAKAKLTVYGSGWQEYIDKKFIASEHLPNDEVPKAYASCSILLNDHWNDMRAAGFISNRLFDAAACGTKVISDHIDGIESIFKGLVKTYRTFGDFEKLLDSKTNWPTDIERQIIAQSIAKEHSFDARARTLIARVNPNSPPPFGWNEPPSGPSRGGPSGPPAEPEPARLPKNPSPTFFPARELY